MTIDVAGATTRVQLVEATYGPLNVPIAYRAKPHHRRLLARRTKNGITVEDPVSHKKASGPTYLDALYALQAE